MSPSWMVEAHGPASNALSKYISRELDWEMEQLGHELVQYYLQVYSLRKNLLCSVENYKQHKSSQIF